MKSAKTARFQTRLVIPNGIGKLRVNTGLALEIGFNEHLVFMQLEYLIAISTAAPREGRNWTYQSAEALTEIFPFWSRATIRRTLKNLEDLNLVVTGNFNEKTYDRTVWYAINWLEVKKLKSVGVMELEESLLQNEARRAQNEARRAQNEAPIPYTSTSISSEERLARQSRDSLEPEEDFDDIHSASPQERAGAPADEFSRRRMTRKGVAQKSSLRQPPLQPQASAHHLLSSGSSDSEDSARRTKKEAAQACQKVWEVWKEACEARGTMCGNMSPKERNVIKLVIAKFGMEETLQYAAYFPKYFKDIKKAHSWIKNELPDLGLWYHKAQLFVDGMRLSAGKKHGGYTPADLANPNLTDEQVKEIEDALRGGKKK